MWDSCCCSKIDVVVERRSPRSKLREALIPKQRKATSNLCNGPSWHWKKGIYALEITSFVSISQFMQTIVQNCLNFLDGSSSCPSKHDKYTHHEKELWSQENSRFHVLFGFLGDNKLARDFKFPIAERFQLLESFKWILSHLYTLKCLSLSCHSWFALASITSLR